MRTTSKTSLVLAVLAASLLGSSSYAYAQDQSAPVANVQPVDGMALQAELFKPWKTKYEKLTRTAASALQSKKPGNYAGQLHLLEVELVHLMKLAASDNKLTPQQQSMATQEARTLLTQIQWSYPSLQTEMRNRFEAAAPGKSGGQIVTRAGGKGKNAVDVFYPSFHSKKKLPQAVQDKLSRDLIEKHKAEHPNTPIHQPLTKGTVGSISSGELLEWVQVPKSGKKNAKVVDGGELRITRNAKHVVTSGGQETLAAGSLKVIWHPQHIGVPEKAIAVFVSNWSGTFQPDIASLEGTMIARLTKLGFNRTNLILTTTMPLEPKIYETFLSMRKSKAKVKLSLTRMAKRAERIKLTATNQWNKVVQKSTPKSATRPVLTSLSPEKAQKAIRNRASTSGTSKRVRVAQKRGAKKAKPTVRRVR